MATEKSSDGFYKWATGVLIGVLLVGLAAIFLILLDRIDSVDNKITNDIGGKDGLREKLVRAEEQLKILMKWHDSEMAFQRMYSQATPEEQKKLWKAKPLFDIEFSRLVRKYGSADAAMKELPALKQQLLKLDDEEKQPSPGNGSKPNTPERQIEKLPFNQPPK